MPFILRRPRVANFADIIKIITMFIETVFKMLSISVFLDITKLQIYGEKMRMSAEIKVCVT